MSLQVLGWSVAVLDSSGRVYRLRISKDLKTYETQFDRGKVVFFDTPDEFPPFSASFKHELAMKLGILCRTSS